LIWPGTGIIGSEVFDSLKYMKNIDLTLSTDNQDVSVIGKEINKIYIPNVSDKSTDWQNILSFINLNYDLIFPTNDLVIDLIVNANTISLEKYILPNRETVKLCRSKKLSAQFFKDKIPVLEEVNLDSIEFPVYFKPDKGYGAKDHQIIYNKIELDLVIKKHPDSFITELLVGSEYTVECFSDFKGDLIYSKPRIRERIQFATSTKLVKPSRESNIALEKYATIINKEIKLDGPWFFQMKEDSRGELKLLEIGIRIPGSAVWSRAFGVNLAELAIYNKKHISTSVICNKSELTIERNMQSKVYLKLDFNYVYIDFDNTIYVNNQVKEETFIFLNKCFYRGIKIILITKYLGSDLSIKLEALRINSLITEVIHISESDSKHKYIEHLDSIFIDDSFSERKEVFNNLKINTYGPDIMELI
jgi:hypothetical protein